MHSPKVHIVPSTWLPPAGMVAARRPAATQGRDSDMATTTRPERPKHNRAFASMDLSKQREIARTGQGGRRPMRWGARTTTVPASVTHTAESRA
jgi:hypothetical protein